MRRQSEGDVHSSNESNLAAAGTEVASTENEVRRRTKPQNNSGQGDGVVKEEEELVNGTREDWTNDV